MPPAAIASLADIARVHGAGTPDKVALEVGDRTVTFGELDSRSSQAAQAFRAAGVEHGDRVAFIEKNGAEFFEVTFGLSKLGAVCVAVNWRLAAPEMLQIIEDAKAQVVVVGPDFYGHVEAIEDQLGDVHTIVAIGAHDRWPAFDAWIADHPAEDPGVETTGDDVAFQLYTSGTTGLPKGVMHNFGAFAWSVDAGLKRIPLTGSDRMLSYLPLAHVVERTLVEHGWLRTGMRVYFAESLDTFAADLQRALPTVFFSVPRLWVKFQQGVQAKMPQHKLDKLLRLPLIGGLVRKKILKALGLNQCKFAAGGAAPMPVALLEWYAKLGLHINEGYGMTENLALSHLTEPGKNQRGTVGPAYPGVEVRIDPDSGELQMRSPAVMLGYYKAPEQTREAFTSDGWLRTGDKASQDPNGCVRITGRVKDLFKTSKGKYVAPAPIEDKLGMNPNIEACCVAGANMGQPLGIAMLSPQGVERASTEAERTALMAELSKHLDDVNARLDPHEQLDALVVIQTPWTVDNGFITPTFKVKRNRIEEVYASKFEAWVGKRAKVLFGD